MKRIAVYPILTIALACVLGALMWWIFTDSQPSIPKRGSPADPDDTSGSSTATNPRLLGPTDALRSGASSEPRKIVNRGPGVYSNSHGFDYPFLGTVSSTPKQEEVALPDGTSQRLQVYRDGHGMLIRAEFAREGAFTWQWSPETMDNAYEMCAERVQRIPPDVQRLSLRQLVKLLDQEIPLAKASQWAITAVQIEKVNSNDGSVIARHNVYEAHVYGVRTAGGRIPDRDPFRKVRYVLTLDGGVIQWDNRL